MKYADNKYQINITMKKRYMPGLDGLRALAVFAVIAYHLNLKWAPGGLLGVCLFFVLSGYLITDLLLNEWDLSGHIDLKDFWLRRARRLLPALFVMLAGVVSWIAAFAPARLETLWGDVLASVFYTSNWWLIFHKVSYFAAFGPPSPLGNLWSLAIEEQFYLVWPILLWLSLRYLPKQKLLLGVTVALALVSVMAMALIYEPGLDPSRVYYGTDTRAFALLIGAALALLWPSRKLSNNLTGKGRLVLDLAGGIGILILVLLIMKTNEYQPFLYHGGLLLFSLAAASVVAVLAHPASRLGRLFALKPLRWLGVRSYGIYLWHYPVIVLTSPAVNTGGVDIARALVQVAASVLLAALSWSIIEKPIRYGRWKGMWTQTHRPEWLEKAMTIRGKASSGKVTMITTITMVCIILVFSVGCLAAGGVEQQAAGKAEPGKSGYAENTQNTQNTQNTKTSENVTKNPGTIDETVTGKSAVASMTDEQEADTGTTPISDKENEDPGQEITVIGDSVMLDAEPELKKRLPGIIVEAKVGRQMYQAPDVIAKLKEQGKIRKTVILELGTNGSFTAEQLKNTLDSLATAERIVLVNTRVPRAWESAVNQTLAEVAASYPKTMLVDWYTASGSHDGYFGPDGVHLNAEGVEAYAALIDKGVNSETP